MKAEELRIGNLVGIESTAIHANGCNHLEAKFEIEEIRNESVHFKGFAYGEFLKDLKPIPLTVEWLKRFGFVKGKFNYLWGYGNFLYDEKLNLWTWYGIQLHDYLIDSVHKLQNLHFALTGQELTIK